MKKNTYNLLFIDKTVASKNFACYFLDNCNLFLLSNKKEKTEEIFSNFSFEQKKKVKFDVIFIFSLIEQKQIEEIKNVQNKNGIILTNNFASFHILTNNSVNAIYVSLDLLKELDINSKLSLQSNTELDLSCFSSNILIKKDENILEKDLSNIILSNAIKSVCCFKNLSVKKLMWQPKSRRLVINLIDEQIKITNSVLFDVNKYFNFDIYRFLSGKNIFSRIKKHIKLFMLLSNYNENLTLNELIFNIEQIIDLNYNKYIEINFLQKILNILKTEYN